VEIVSTPRNVGVFVGSLRKESFTRKIARAMIGLAPPALSLSFVEISELAIYNQDLEEAPPKPWADFRQRVRGLDGALFVTPEYNRGLPAAMKNAIDVGSRPHGKDVWDGKPAGVVSVTPGGLGSMASHHQLRHALFAVGMAALPAPEIYIANVKALLSPDGAVTNEQTRELLRSYLQSLAEWIERITLPLGRGVAELR
jgi:chromate reductase